MVHRNACHPLHVLQSLTQQTKECVLISHLKASLQKHENQPLADDFLPQVQGNVISPKRSNRLTVHETQMMNSDTNPK